MFPQPPGERPEPDPYAPTIPNRYLAPHDDTSGDQRAQTERYNPPGAAWPPPSPMGPYYTPPTLPQRNGLAWAPFLGGVLVTLLIIVAIFALIRNGIVTLPSRANGQTPVATGITATSTPTSGSTSTTTAGAPTTTSAIIPTGSLLYATALPGQCDTQGAIWATNGYVGQACANGALQAQGASNCNCPLGVVVLQRLPSTTLPPQYILQVTLQSVGPGDTDRFGIKFYQEDNGASPPDSEYSRGGFSFLIDRTGAWTFNRYTNDGTLTTLDTGNYVSGVAGQHTIDLSVGASSFAFFIDGTQMATEYDSAYSSGLLDLAVEPGAVVDFRNFALYHQPGQ